MYKSIFSLLILSCLSIMGSAQSGGTKRIKASGTIRGFQVHMLGAKEADLPFDAILKVCDSLASKSFFVNSIFAIPSKTDSTRPRMLIFQNQVVGTGNWKFRVDELYENGNTCKSYCYDKNFKQHPLWLDLYADASVKEWRKFMNGKPVGNQDSYNEQGQLTKREKYKRGIFIKANRGVLKKVKVYAHPHRTWKTIFEHRNKKGVEWRIS
jgi:hypothetical protein